MYHLTQTPKVVDINGIKIGGQIGENPIATVIGLFSEEFLA